MALRIGVVCAVGALLLVAAPASFARHTCGPAKAETWEQNADARVYLDKGRVFACLYRSPRRPVALGTVRNRKSSGPFLSGPWDVELAGRAVSTRWSYSVLGNRSEVHRLIVRDLAARRVTFRYGPKPQNDNGVLIGLPILKPNGSAAWMEVRNPYGQRVVIHDRSGTRVVDQSRKAALELGSLAANGVRTTVYWLHGGVARHAPID